MGKSNNSLIATIYYVSIVLLMLSSMGTSWLWFIPRFVLLWFTFFTTLLSISSGIIVFEKESFGILLVYTLISIIGIISSPALSVSGFVLDLIHATTIMGVILLRENRKVELFNCFVKILSLVLWISIPAWLLYLAGVPFSHGNYIDVGDGFHFLHDYRFFVISDLGERADFMRFSSVFMEPGWIGTICCFTIFGLGLNVKRIPTWLCGLGLFLSMSLSAVINLIICGLLWIWQMSKHRILWLCLFVGSLFGIALYAVNYNGGDNVVNRLVIERLVFDEDLGIVGNNRTNDDFETHYEETMTGADKWFGIAHEADRAFRETTDWYNRSSGIKKELLTNGYVGTGLFVLFLLLLLFRARSKQGFVFFVCFVLASLIRDLWRSDCYLVLYIVAISTLYAESLSIRNNGRVIKKKNHKGYGLECG